MAGSITRLGVASAVAALAPAIAWAQTESSPVVATAHPAPAPVAPDTQVSELSAAPAVDDPQRDGAPNDRRIHGEISVGAGTGGYREVNAAATAPIGATGEASVAIDAGQFGGRR